MTKFRQLFTSFIAYCRGSAFVVLIIILSGEGLTDLESNVYGVHDLNTMINVEPKPSEQTIPLCHYSSVQRSGKIPPANTTSGPF